MQLFPPFSAYGESHDLLRCAVASSQVVGQSDQTVQGPQPPCTENKEIILCKI